MFKGLKIKKIISTSIFLTISTSILASDKKEVWECKDLNGEWNNILVTATAIKETGEGIIKVAGIEHFTKFEIAGFDRQWRFGKISTTDKYKYVFRIKPNGVAHYFNMPVKKSGEFVESEMVLLCRAQGTGWSVKLSEKQKSNTDNEHTIRPCLPGFFIMNYDE